MNSSGSLSCRNRIFAIYDKKKDLKRYRRHWGTKLVAFGTNNNFKHYFSTRIFFLGGGEVTRSCGIQRNEALVSEITKRGWRVTELTAHLGLTAQDNPSQVILRSLPISAIPGESRRSQSCDADFALEDSPCRRGFSRIFFLLENIHATLSWDYLLTYRGVHSQSGTDTPTAESLCRT